MRIFRHIILLSAILGIAGCSEQRCTVRPSSSDLVFTRLATSWDEAVPLGNATVGALVWRKDSSLRMSLDRTDLWDLCPMDSLSGPRYSFEWVKEQIRKGDYLPVQKKFDWPYDRKPAPAKIPGAALEFSLALLGEPESVRLYIQDALCEIIWPDSTVMQTFVDANRPIGWFAFHNLKSSLVPSIIPPVYSEGKESAPDNSHAGGSIKRLGYRQGDIVRKGDKIIYHQPGYGDFAYDVAVSWRQDGTDLYGVWSVTSTLGSGLASDLVDQAMERGMHADYGEHLEYWDSFWAQSSVSLPDCVLQKQYDNEMYKLGSTSRKDSYPISLQAVWTADNGYLPPWKGDYHHDLNTQLSYWPVYAGNHLDEGLGYLNTLWNQRETYRKYTRQYFGTDGLNVPGVATLTGEPMGGWIQYSMSQCAGAWLAHHFYKHWRFSTDDRFLKERAYPFVKDVATYMEQVSQTDSTGTRRLEFSSSPEMLDNSIEAWFKNTTNFDLALMKFIFSAGAEMADSLDYEGEAGHWRELYGQLPDYDLDEEGALTIAKGYPYAASHRHFSHALAIHPLGLIDKSHGAEESKIIDTTISKLDKYGPDWWTGYSWAWLGNLKARALDGEGAAKALRTFADAFCSPNTFHLNGDQSGTGKSRFTYRPFTLEGNFAFAAGIQEMLLQSHTSVISLFPAIPDSWKNVGFTTLRADGGVTVSATLRDGTLTEVKACASKTGTYLFRFGNRTVSVQLDAGQTTNITAQFR